MALFKFQCAAQRYSEISAYDFRSETDLVKSGSHTGVFQRLWNSGLYRGTPPQVSVLFLGFPTHTIWMCFLWPSCCTDSPLFYMFWFIPQLLWVCCHSGCFGFVVCIQRRPVVVSIPSVCVSSCAVCPLCLSSLLLAQSLDRKWEIYFIWLELHCSFLTTGVTSL